jgi:hypothetical protein
MFIHIVRYIKRLAVFIPGIIIAYVSLKYTLPFFDRRVPEAVGILASYGLAAYVLLPAIIRFWRILKPPHHLPLYCVTPDGFASDPLNIGIIGTRRHLIDTMEKAGWYQADPHTIVNMTRQILSITLGWSYPTGPMSGLYLFGRKQDIGFEIPTDAGGSSRHHVRFWATTFEGKKKLSARSIHWHHRKAHILGDELLWVGAASLDIGIVPIKHNWQLTHMVDPDTNQERELIVSGLKAKKLVSKTETLKLGDPYRLVNRTWRGELHTDGFMKVIWLKNNRPKI